MDAEGRSPVPGGVPPSSSWWRLFLVLAVPWLLLVYRSRFVTDDAYITFRYARNWSMGRGLRYNLDGPPVEGFSEFLWVALSALTLKVGLEPADVLSLVSVGCGLAVLGLTLSLGLRLGLGEAATGVAGLLLIALPTTSVWATGGLATMAHALLLLAAVDLLAFRADAGAASLSGSRRDALAALLGAALVLVRVEGPAWVLVAAAAAAVGRWRAGRPVVRPLAPFLLGAAATFGVYETWRVATYDAWVANTVSAKVSSGLEVWLRGARYVGSFALTPLTPVLAVPAAMLAWRRPETLVLAVPVVGTVAYVVLAGGDFMSHFRLMLAATPFLALLVGVGVHAATLRFPRAAGALVAGAAVVAALGVLPAFDVHLLPRALRARHDGQRLLDPEQAEFAVTTEQQHWLRMRERAEDGVRVGRALRRIAERDDSVVLSAIGAIGYYSRLPVIDRNGLVERGIRRRQPQRQKGHLPGHERTLSVQQTLTRNPDILGARLYDPGPICRRSEPFVSSLRFRGYAPVLTEVPGPRWLVTVQRVDDPRAAEVAFGVACEQAGEASRALLDDEG